MGGAVNIEYGNIEKNGNIDFILTSWWEHQKW